MRGKSTASRVRDGWRNVLIIAGRVIDVDPGKWTCTVATEVGRKTLYNVDMGAQYLHPFDGEGAYIMPETGAAVWVCRSSEGDYPYFILKYRGYPKKTVAENTNQNSPNLTTNRPRMSPGEMVLQTRDRNGLRLRRGGVTEVYGSPLARTIYSARRGRVHTLAKNLVFDVFGGSLIWKVERAEKDPSGNAPTRLEWRMKEKADDRSHIAQIDAGGQVEAAADAEVVMDPVVTLRVFKNGDKEEDSLKVASSLSLDKSGQVELRQEGKLSIEVRGTSNATLTMDTDGSFSLETDGRTDVSSSGRVTITSAAAVINKGATALLTTETRLDGLGLKVGAGTAPAIYDDGLSDDMAAALAELIVIGKIAGAPSTTALEALLENFLSKAYSSQKLTTE